MAGFEVNIFLDVDRFEAALDDWSARTVTETDSASLEAAEFVKELVQTNLGTFPHPRSEPTPAPEFKGPVGLISGDLRSSVEVRAPLRGTAIVGVYSKYARIQELGGWCGNDHMTYLAPRPYFRPMVMEVDTRGPSGVEHIYYEHWREAMMRAVAF